MKAFLLGAIQGITEFLPISSDGHLFLLKKVLHIQENYLPFFVFLHLPTLLAVCIFFRREIISIFFKRFLWWHIILITFITGLIALFIKHFFEPFFENKYLVCICFLINGFILLAIKGKSNKVTNDINFKDSSIIGFLQGWAALPGISRSAITLMGLMRSKFKKEDAFSLSFIISIPIIILAFVVEYKELVAMKNLNFSFLLVGFISAFLFGLISLKIVKEIITRFNFNILGFYCFIMGLLCLLI